jgi:soluble lytic murein transglycosylase-like protein
VEFQKYNDGRAVDPFDAEISIRVGIRYLAALYSATGSWSAAIAAYNVGLGGWRSGVRPVRHIEAIMGDG